MDAAEKRNLKFKVGICYSIPESPFPIPLTQMAWLFSALLLSLLLLSGLSTVQAQVSGCACEGDCGAALRNQDAVRANLRVDSFEASSERQIDRLIAEIAYASAETKAELARFGAEAARASAETMVELARAGAETKVELARTSAELNDKFERLRASFISWAGGPAGNIIFFNAFALFSFLFVIARSD